jgi:hypothetical protein
MTKQLDIYWEDLNASAKKRLREDLYHENIDMSPIATIEIEKEEFVNLKEEEELWE